jgi:hypothetical protein
VPTPSQAPTFNALKHGGTANKHILPNEDPAAFASLLEGLMDEYRPDTVQSRIFVENLAEAHWFLARRQRAFDAIESAIYEHEPDVANWTEHHLKRLALADRYKTQAERALKRALNNLESWRKWTRGERDRERRTAQWLAEQDLRERRLALTEEKSRAAQSRHTATGSRFAKNAFCSPTQHREEPETVTVIAEAPSSQSPNTSLNLGNRGKAA